MSLRIRAPIVLSLSLVFSAFILALPGAVAATSCGTHSMGSSWDVFTNKVSGQMVKQADLYENFSGGTVTATFTVSSTTSQTDSVSASAAVSASVKAAIFADFEATMSAEMGSVGQVTYFGSVSYTTPLATGDTYVFYAGTKYYTGSYTRWTCSTSGQGAFIAASGNVAGYLAHAQGVVGCKQLPGSTTLAYRAKQLYC